MKDMKDLPIDEIDRLFRDAAGNAQKEADGAGLPRVGNDDWICSQCGLSWQPIGTAPRDGSAILVFTADCEMVVAYWAEAQAFGWSDWCDNRDRIRLSMNEKQSATHWMPLPPPPHS